MSESSNILVCIWVCLCCMCMCVCVCMYIYMYIYIYIYTIHAYMCIYISGSLSGSVRGSGMRENSQIDQKETSSTTISATGLPSPLCKRWSAKEL